MYYFTLIWGYDRPFPVEHLSKWPKSVQNSTKNWNSVKHILNPSKRKFGTPRPVPPSQVKLILWFSCWDIGVKMCTKMSRGGASFRKKVQKKVQNRVCSKNHVRYGPNLFCRCWGILRHTFWRPRVTWITCILRGGPYFPAYFLKGPL